MLISGLLYLCHCFDHIAMYKITASRGNASLIVHVLPDCSGRAESTYALGNTLRVADDFFPQALRWKYPCISHNSALCCACRVIFLLE